MSIPLPPLPHWNEEMYRQQIKVLEDALQAASDAILHIRDMHWTHWTAQEQEEAGNAAYAARDALVPRDTQGDDI